MIVVESKRDQRVRNWLVEQVGHAGVIEASAKLARPRRTYPSNIPNVFGLVRPQRLEAAATADASDHLERSCT